MDLHVKGKNIPVTDALFEHAERKLAKLTRFLPPWDEPPVVELELSVERNPSIERNQVAEVTVRTKGPVLRVRESDRDMYLAIDHAVNKMQRQATRYRDRRRRHRLPHGQHPPTTVESRSGGSSTDVTLVPQLKREQGPQLLAVVPPPIHVIADQPRHRKRIEQALTSDPVR